MSPYQLHLMVANYPVPVIHKEHDTQVLPSDHASTSIVLNLSYPRVLDERTYVTLTIITVLRQLSVARPGRNIS